jgi:hypothetical protein
VVGKTTTQLNTKNKAINYHAAKLLCIEIWSAIMDGFVVKKRVYISVPRFNVLTRVCFIMTLCVSITELRFVMVSDCQLPVHILMIVTTV